LSEWALLLETAIAYGLFLSLVLTAISLIAGAIALDMFVGDYPPDIKERYGPMSPRSARLRPLFATLLFLPALIIPFAGLVSLQGEVGSVPVAAAFVFSALVLLVFNTYDLIVLDWIFFCTIQPRQMVLPGTEGMAGYRDYRFHFIGFLKGLGFCAAGALLVTGLWILAENLIVQGT
jgi:hypothetical protein